MTRRKNDPPRQHICEQCLKWGLWDKRTWRYIFAISRVDDCFPVKFCCQQCEDDWFDGKPGAPLPEKTS